jgi:hypothetical protein
MDQGVEALRSGQRDLGWSGDRVDTVRTAAGLDAGRRVGPAPKAPPERAHPPLLLRRHRPAPRPHVNAPRGPSATLRNRRRPGRARRADAHGRRAKRSCSSFAAGGRGRLPGWRATPVPRAPFPATRSQAPVARRALRPQGSDLTVSFLHASLSDVKVAARSTQATPTSTEPIGRSHQSQRAERMRPRREPTPRRCRG